MTRLDNKVAFITGGESGIGLATARLFAAEGARVHLAGLHARRLAEAVTELGPDVAACSVTDVTDEGQVIAAVAQAVDRFGGLDVLFSNAGISGAIAPITEYPTDVFRRVMDVHVLGAFHLLKHAWPHPLSTGPASRFPRIAPPGRSAGSWLSHPWPYIQITTITDRRQRRP